MVRRDIVIASMLPVLAVVGSCAPHATPSVVSLSVEEGSIDGMHFENARREAIERSFGKPVISTVDDSDRSGTYDTYTNGIEARFDGARTCQNVTIEFSKAIVVAKKKVSVMASYSGRFIKLSSNTSVSAAEAFFKTNRLPRPVHYQADTRYDSLMVPSSPVFLTFYNDSLERIDISASVK